MDTTNTTASYSFFLGLTTRGGDDLTEILNHEGVTNKIANILDQYNIDCFTIIPTVGVWKHTEEVSCIIYVCGVLSSDVKAIAEELATEFDQDCVGVRPEKDIELINNPL